MSPGKRISKRQIKQDKLVSTTFKVTEYIEQKKKLFISTLAAVIAIALIFYLISYNISSKNKKALELFGRAQLAGAMNQPTLSINDYRAVIEQYGSTGIAGRSCYYLAKAYYDNKNCDSALVYFEMYINEYGKEKLLFAAAYDGAANCLERQADFAKAGEYYFKAAELVESEQYSPDYYLAAGRAYQKAGLLEDAEIAYQRIVDNYTKSPSLSKAKRKLAELKFKKQSLLDSEK